MRVRKTEMSTNGSRGGRRGGDGGAAGGPKSFVFPSSQEPCQDTLMSSHHTASANNNVTCIQQNSLCEIDQVAVRTGHTHHRIIGQLGDLVQVLLIRQDRPAVRLVRRDDDPTLVRDSQNCVHDDDDSAIGW